MDALQASLSVDENGRITCIFLSDPALLSGWNGSLLTAVMHPADLLALHSVKAGHASLRGYANGAWQTLWCVHKQVDGALHLDLFACDAAPLNAPDLPPELAGHIVHSLNNYLSGVSGFTELALLDVPPQHPAHGQLRTVLESAGQAVKFGENLLAAAGRRALQRGRVGLRDTVQALLTMHAESLQGFDAITALPENAWLELDVALFQQAMADLLRWLQAGARDVQLDYFCAERHCLLRFTAPGKGFDAQHAAHLFAPYYASRVLRGERGLGLAPAAGLMRQMQIAHWAEAEAGVGAAITLLLPLCDVSVREASVHEASVHETPSVSVQGDAQGIADVWVCAAQQNVATAVSGLRGLPVRVVPVTESELFALTGSTAVVVRAPLAIFGEQALAASVRVWAEERQCSVWKWSALQASGDGVLFNDLQGDGLRETVEALL